MEEDLQIVFTTYANWVWRNAGTTQNILDIEISYTDDKNISVFCAVSCWHVKDKISKINLWSTLEDDFKIWEPHRDTPCILPGGTSYCKVKEAPQHCVMLAPSSAGKLKTIPLSIDTVSRWTEDHSNRQKQQTTAWHMVILPYQWMIHRHNKQSSFTCLHETCRDGDLQEQFLCTTTMIAEDTFSSVDLYLSSVGLSWDMFIGITIDGAACMTGKNPECNVEPLFLYQEALAAKDLVSVLHGTLKDVIQVVNYIEHSAKNTWCFEKLCQDLGSEHVQVLYHALYQGTVPFLWALSWNHRLSSPEQFATCRPV